MTPITKVDPGLDPGAAPSLEPPVALVAPPVRLLPPVRPDAPARSVAIVHDYLTQRGGAERAVLTMRRAFPQAPIHTSLYDPDGTFPQFADADITTSPLDRVGLLRRRHRLALPALAPTFGSMQVDADVVVCSSSGWAHGVQTDGRKVVYCYAPARWLYQTEAYLAGRGPLARAAVRAVRPALRRWDRRAAATADVYLAISTRTQRLLQETYGIEAALLHPPLGVDPRGPAQPVDGLDPGFHLTVARLLPYKNVDAVIEAFAELPDQRLVVVGKGPDAARLHALAPTNVTFLEGVTDDELRWLYANAEALIGASFEDFGLTPIEAATFGTPSVVLRFGGYLDTVIEGRTGVFFDRPEPAAIARAVREATAITFAPMRLQTHAAKFAPEVFVRELRQVVDTC